MASRINPLARLAGSIEVGLLLWRAQLRMFLNQTVRSRRPARIVLSAAGALVILLAWAWEVIVTLVVVQASRRAPVSIDAVSLLSLAFFAYTAVLVFSSLVFSLNALLLNPDLDLLLVAPRPVETILGGRMVVQVLRLMLLGLLFTAPALLVLAVVNGNPLIPLIFAGVYLLYPVYVVVIISLLSLLVVRIIPAGRGREILTIFGVLVALGINLVNFLVNPALRSPGGVGGFGRRPPTPPSLPDVPLASAPWFPTGWAGRATAGILAGDWSAALTWLGLMLAVSAFVFVVGAGLSGRLYLAGWVQAVRPRHRPARAARARRVGWRWLPGLSPVEAAIVRKDWRLRTRDLAQLVRFAMPVVFLVVIFVLRFPRLIGTVQQLGPGPTAAMLALIPAWVVLFSLALSLGLSAVSLEGRSIWVYAASPNSTMTLLLAKCWSAALPVVLLIGAVEVASEVLVRPGWLWAVTAILAGIGLAAAIMAVMVGLGAIFARFDWTDARRMTNPAAVFLGMALFVGLSLATVVLFGISVALAGAIHLPLFTTWLVAMLMTLGAALALAAVTVLLGDRRLRGLELG